MSKLHKMKPGILSVNFGVAGEIEGAQLGAIKIRDFILSNNLAEDIGVVPSHDSIINKDISIEIDLLHISENIRDIIVNECSQERAIFIAGGDHSIALGSIAGASIFAERHKKKFGVIYIDAHADINVPQTSPSGHLHGMPLAFSMGLGESPLSYVATSPLCIQNLLYIGTRSVDEPEAQLLQSHSVSIISSNEIIEDYKYGLNHIIEKIDYFISLRQLDYIHLSVDIDVVSPEFAPATGVPVPNGILPGALKTIISHLLNNYDIRTVDLVEYNPLLDNENKTEIIIKEISEMIANGLA